MGRGRATSIETIQLIKATYALNGSVSDTSRDLGVPESTVRKYISPENKDEFAEVRAEKIAEAIPAIVDLCAKAQIKLLNAIMDEDGLKKASLQEKAITFGVVTDKLQLITGEATERHEHRNTTEARQSIARRIDELAERRRARGVAGESVGGGGA